MAQINRETRTGRRIAKKKYTRRFLSIVAVSAVVMSGFAYSKNSSADNKKESQNVSVELSTEKIDRDTVKIQLDNFAPLVKSIQLNVAIDGNAKFKENTIKWLANSDSNDVKTHVKMGDGNKSMQIFIVSDEPLNRVGANLEICEIDVEKASIGSSAYTIDSKLVDGAAYSYVLNDTNKQVTGTDMANLSEDKLTINSAPVISLKSSTSIVDGNIVISKGDTLDAKSYIVVNDEEDGEISLDKVTVTGKVDIKKVSTYSITYSVTDNDGDTTTLDQTVIVEDVNKDDVTAPVINVNKNGVNGEDLTFVAGDDVNLSDYITAVDYSGRNIEVKITGDYNLDKAGTYKITVIAEDRFGNKVEEEVTIVVTEKTSEPSEPGDEGQQPGDGEQNPGNGEEEQPGDGEQQPGDIEIVIPEEVVNNGGNATEESPLVLETTKVTAAEEFISEAKNDFKLTVIDKKVLNNSIEYSIRLEEKSFIARLLSRSKVYYVKLTVPNTDEFSSVFDELEIEDTTAPILKYDGELNITVENGSEFKIPVVTATDNFDDNVAVKTVIKDEAGKVVDKIDTTKAGKYTITYIGTDNSGNTSESLIIVVEVKAVNQGGGSQNPGGGEETPDSGDQTPVKPEVSVKPENSEVSDDSINVDSNTDNKENNQNKIPQTGQGIFYGITVAIAAVVVGIGIYLLRKKK